MMLSTQSSDILLAPTNTILLAIIWGIASYVPYFDVVRDQARRKDVQLAEVIVFNFIVKRLTI